MALTQNSVRKIPIFVLGLNPAGINAPVDSEEKFILLQKASRRSISDSRGRWTVVILEEIGDDEAGVEDTHLRHEFKEIALRQNGIHRIWAHKLADQSNWTEEQIKAALAKSRELSDQDELGAAGLSSNANSHGDAHMSAQMDDGDSIAAGRRDNVVQDRQVTEAQLDSRRQLTASFMRRLKRESFDFLYPAPADKAESLLIEAKQLLRQGRINEGIEKLNLSEQKDSDGRLRTRIAALRRKADLILQYHPHNPDYQLLAAEPIVEDILELIIAGRATEAVNVAAQGAVSAEALATISHVLLAAARQVDREFPNVQNMPERFDDVSPGMVEIILKRLGRRNIEEEIQEVAPNYARRMRRLEDERAQIDTGGWENVVFLLAIF